MNNALRTFLVRPSVVTLGAFDGQDPFSEAIRAGTAKGKEDRQKVMADVAPLITNEMSRRAQVSAASVTGYQELIVKAQAPVLAASRALEYARANSSEATAWLPICVELGQVTLADAADLGYSASEFARYSVVPKDWKPAVAGN